MKGRIHSIESFGTVDGPGLRCVIFLQGCALRCRYCHNPDTWNTDWGQEMDSEEVLRKVARFKPYFSKNGGITLSGGEPLLQSEFAAFILKKCREMGIHTAIDTSGWVEIAALEKVLPYTDLLLLDIKALDEDEYLWLTGKSENKFRKALEYIQQWNIPLRLRYVLLPGINDSDQHVKKLKNLTARLGSQVNKIEVLPYHNLGAHKWKKLGLNYSLGHLKPPGERDINQFIREINEVHLSKLSAR